MVAVPRIVLTQCPTPYNPVLSIEANGFKAFYGIPLHVDHANVIIAHTESIETIEALRRLEPGDYTIYAPAGSMAARIALALGHRVAEVHGEENVNGRIGLRRGVCGLYAKVSNILLTPPCSVSTLYQEVLRMAFEGVEAIVAAAYGVGVDEYLHRLGVALGKPVYLVECAYGLLGRTGTVLDIALLRVGASLDAD